MRKARSRGSLTPVSQQAAKARSRRKEEELGNLVGTTAPFTWGIMDSVIVSGRSASNKFFSSINELDNLYLAPNGGKQDAIIPDGILGPGTRIEYFVTSYYVCTPSICYLLPDTTLKLDDPTKLQKLSDFWCWVQDPSVPVAAGVFWSQLTAGGYRSNKKMVILR